MVKAMTAIRPSRHLGTLDGRAMADRLEGHKNKEMTGHDDI